MHEHDASLPPPRGTGGGTENLPTLRGALRLRGADGAVLVRNAAAAAGGAGDGGGVLLPALSGSDRGATAVMKP
ncbi:hypothetical protein FACS189497_06600 [Betaproteobacteria bacterium]|nr:hypothetical protein FACS189497_06600 [Betaproteobacteria bacterium]